MSSSGGWFFADYMPFLDPASGGRERRGSHHPLGKGAKGRTKTPSVATQFAVAGYKWVIYALADGKRGVLRLIYALRFA